MTPGDRAILSRLKSVVERMAAYGVVDGPDQPAHDRDAGQRREIALGDAEGHVGTATVAPLGGDVPAAKDHAVRPTTGPHGTEHVVRRPGLVRDADIAAGVGQKVTPPRRLVSAVVVDRGGETVRAQPQLDRWLRLPLVARRVI